MKTPIRKQFEEAIRKYDGWFVSNKKTAITDEAIKVADNMAIEFGLFILSRIKDGKDHDLLSNADLLSAFKKEVYGE